MFTQQKARSVCTHTHAHSHEHSHAHTHHSWVAQWEPALPQPALQIFGLFLWFFFLIFFFLTRKACSPPFTRENKLLKCEMKPCLIKKGIRQAGAILLVEQRSGRGDES